MNYQIIKDEKAFKKFIEYLPVLHEGECYYVCLFARKKYHSSAANDKSQCKRFVATSKEWLERKVRQLEVPVGNYKNKNGTDIHEDSLALYININPRSFKKAQKGLLKTLVDKVLEPNNLQNVNALSLSELQKAKSGAMVVDFDFDTNYNFHYFWNHMGLKEILNHEGFDVIKTRGGFHLLVNPFVVHQVKNWHHAISKIQYCDVAGDNLIPFVGCCQGNFVPRLEIIQGQTIKDQDA